MLRIRSPRCCLETLVYAVMLAAGCGASGGGDEPSGIGGSWSGTWRSDPIGYEGALVAELTQSGAQITGTIAATGSACLTVASVNGTVNGLDLRFDAALGVDRLTFVSTLDSLTPHTFGGPFSVTEGTCSGDRGRFDLSR